MVHKQIMGIIPAVQAASLVGHNIKVAKKKEKNVKDILDLGITNIVGTSLIGLEASLIGGL